jgi:poly-beta-1,6-N-acetyl-D-glucosamine synthase
MLMSRETLYAIITPAHNEAGFLPDVVASIAAQTIKPVQWIIVDDRSTDATWDVLLKEAKKFDFITPVHRTGSAKRSVGTNVVHVFNEGYQHLTESVEFVVKMDADVVLPTDYFERIVQHFDQNDLLGMASGKTFIKEHGGWVLERISDTHVSGACKTYRKRCFDQMGGLIPLLGWDILDGAKARMLQWQTRSYRDLPLYHLRKSSSAKGMVRGRLRTGLAMYTIRAHPLFIIGKSLFRTFEKPYLSGLLIPIGYALSFLKGAQRLQDKQLALFLRHEQTSRLFGKTRKQEEFFSRRVPAK